MKRYIFCKELNGKLYYLGQFNLDMDLIDSSGFAEKIEEFILSFSNEKSSYLLLIEYKGIRIGTIYFNSLEEIKNTFSFISSLYNEGLEERFTLLDRLTEQELQKFIIPEYDNVVYSES